MGQINAAAGRAGFICYTKLNVQQSLLQIPLQLDRGSSHCTPPHPSHRGIGGGVVAVPILHRVHAIINSMNYVQLFQFKWIGPLTICFLLPFSFASAQSCGDIISINPYSGDTERVAIEDCSDPFAPNQSPPENLGLMIDGVEVPYDTGQVSIPGEFFRSIFSTDRNQYIEQLYEKSGDDFVQINLRPPDIEDLSLEEGLSIVEEYYADDSDLEVYRQAFITNDMSILTDEQNMSYSNFLFSGLPQLLQEQYSPQVPTGSYWLVFTEEVLCVSKAPTQKSWLTQAFDHLIPTAHAQFNDRCAPGYVPKRFVVELDITQESNEPTGASSVLFLPGIQASRLYAGEDIVLPGFPNNVERGNKLWEQTNDKRIALLAMDETGQSVYDIYTEDVVEEVTGRAFGANIYKGFLGLLEDLKTDVDPDTGTTTITDYLPFAYDWRYSVFDIATQPVQYENEVKLLKDEVISLADNSHTEKVTIVAHSNGGLVAKALLHEYGDNELKGLVDKVVMIGTPQLGTPKGVSALLHGQVMEGFGDFLTSDALLRETILNMPGTYTLLPSVRYLEEVADEPLVRVIEGFDLSVYDGVSSRSDLDALLLDSQNVVGPNPAIEKPLQLNGTMLQNALAEQTILDAWQPPAGVEVYEVAGTGIPTPAAIHYEEVPVITCPNAAAVFLATQCEVTIGLKPKLQTTIKGDKTVVLGSARGQLRDKQTLTVNLDSAGDGFRIDRDHSNLTETPAIQSYVKSVLRFPYVTDTLLIPEFSELRSSYTIYAGHSPVTLRIITPDGQITGLVDGEIREDVFGSQFLTLAGSTYLIIRDDVTDYTLEVVGTGNGAYTLETSKLSPDDTQTVVTSFVASTTDAMIARMDVTGGELGQLQVDFNNDGTVDEIRTSSGDLVLADPSVTEVATDPDVKSSTSATRVGDRSAVPQVLGASVSVESLTTDQLQLLQTVVLNIQQLLQDEQLSAIQLKIVSNVLVESLLIVNK
jgi:pimeloyl-ACP methyl ester carboxylesterase